MAKFSGITGLGSMPTRIEACIESSGGNNFSHKPLFMYSSKSSPRSINFGFSCSDVHVVGVAAVAVLNTFLKCENR